MGLPQHAARQATRRARLAEGKAAKLNKEVTEVVATLQNKDKQIKKLQVATRMKTVKLKQDILDNVELIQNMFQVRRRCVVVVVVSSSSWSLVSWLLSWLLSSR